MSKSTVRFFEYAACATCRKAKQWLGAHGVSYQSVPIVEHPPTMAELSDWVKKSGLPVNKWFNTSGQSYRALMARIGKEGFARLDDREKLELLAADGKMIKRPLLVDAHRIVVGFDEAAYAAAAR
ncbi:MAG TPA: Spx/MgsR family RNA polymerase-binding regulatory protein [Polyangiaceae bacterium]